MHLFNDQIRMELQVDNSGAEIKQASTDEKDLEETSIDGQTTIALTQMMINMVSVDILKDTLPGELGYKLNSESTGLKIDSTRSRFVESFDFASNRTLVKQASSVIYNNN